MRAAIDCCDNCFLHEADAQTRDWVNCIRELAHDIENWADLVALRIHVSGGRSTTLCFRILRRLGCNWRMLSIRRAVASELSELKQRISMLPVRRRNLPDWHASCWVPQPDKPVVGPGLTTDFDDGRLVGFEGPTEEVTKMVAGVGGMAVLKIVSIVGMAGSGKTALAAAVYRQLGQQNCFQFQALVSVGNKSVEQAIQDMLSKHDYSHQGGRFEDITQPIPWLGEILKNNRYLIVVDDLWSSEDWGEIKRFFPENSLGSRIITTTRDRALANICCPGSSHCIYNIGLLNKVDSRKLILDRAFGIGHGCPPHLEDVLAQITRRCSGLPLALVTVASMLEDKFSKAEWERLIASRWSSHSHPDAEVMRQILNRSYSVLPQRLKACLLDLSIFPEDFKVDVDRLMGRWIAERYISEKDQRPRRSFNELLSRNMVQRLPPIHGAPRYCRLHPVIHDFVVCKSMERNCVTLVDDQSPPISSNCTVYRLSLQSSKHDRDVASNDCIDSSHVRSITIFGQVGILRRLTNLRVVRVLDLEGCVGPGCLDVLGKLPLLRYLSIKGTDVAELPASLWELRFLVFLDIRSTKVKQLPPSIVGLQHSLRTLFIGHEGMINAVETATRIANDIQHCRRLENVATIDLREYPESFVKALGDLNALRMLEIIWSFQQCIEGAYCEALRSSMENWRNLRSLTIQCEHGCSMEFLDSLSYPPKKLEEFKVTAGVFLSVPDWIKTLRYLSVLQITICKIGTDDLNLLRELPLLQCLILGLDFVPRNAVVIERDGFRELLRFSVDCPVPWLNFQEGSMPKLTHLQLEFCSGSENPSSVPFGISELQRLTEVVLLYNKKWCADSSSVRRTVEAVKTEVAQHRNLIELIINDTKVDVQKVDVEMNSTTEIQSGDVGEDTARTTVETQDESEIQAECDNICSTY